MPSVSAHVALTLAQHVDAVFGVMGNDEELRTAILEASPAKSKAALQAHLDDAVQRIVAKRG